MSQHHDESRAVRDLLDSVGLAPAPIEAPADPDAIYRRSVAMARPRDTAAERRPRHVWRPAAAVAALALVIVVMTPSAMPGDSSAYAAPLVYSYVKKPSQWRGSPGVEPRPTLGKLAAAAGARADSPRAGTVQHTTSFSWTRASSENQPAAAFTSRWLDPDGTLTLSTVREPASPNPTDMSVDLSESAHAGRPAATLRGQVTQMSVDPKLFTPQAARALSSEPDVLLAQLADTRTCPQWTTTGFCLAGRYLDMYEAFAVPGRVDASMWQALERSRDTRNLGTVTDRTGRRGVGISVPESNGPRATLLTLIADPETGKLLGVEWLTTDGTGSSTSASVTSYEYFGDSSWVARVPASK